ncbi:helix-turn-helix domain-containing protein, partial [Levilactobacillus namurensis]|uniref:helix-turn-helix domain-containing protein n=1 Tax=Levilactobacillus namurensis TaxID=380393 RepID=UPI000465EF7D
MELFSKLKLCRSNAGMTQADVASKLLVSRKTVSGWENGRSYPDIGSLVRLSDLYNVTLDDLLRDDRVIEHYDCEIQNNVREKRIFNLSLFLNIVFLVLAYLDLVRPFGFHFAAIPVILL